MTDLIVNGDAEQGLTGWLTVAGTPVVLRYDTGQGYPGPGDPGPAQRGTSFFGGGNTPLSTLRQSVTLPRQASQFEVSAWLGGYASQQDGARLSVEPLRTVRTRHGATRQPHRRGDAAIDPIRWRHVERRLRGQRLVHRGRPLMLNRRDLLRAAAAAGALGTVWPLAQGLSPAQALAAAKQLGATYDPAPFTLGVGSGDPLPDSVILWTRLAPEPLAFEQQLPEIVEVEWTVATDREMRNRVSFGTVAASNLLGHSVHVPVQGLRSGQSYYYQFRALGKLSRVGRTRTAPVGPVSKVRFATANCQAFHDGFYAAHRGIAREELDFVVHLGDYIYEHGQVGGSHVRDHEGPAVLSLADYRRRHALYKGDPSLRDAHAAHPFYLTWDDHEVVNDYSGSEGAAPFVKRLAAAYQAWYEHLPIRSGSALEPQIYRRRQWGDLLDLTVLDLRQYRSAQNLSGGTILGAEQKSWLLDGISSSREAWQCWANSIMLSQLARQGGGYYFTDQWDGFRAERREVLGHVASTGMQDLVVVTGDWHSAFVDDIRPDFDDLSSPVIGTEFTAHSISSGAYSPAWNSTNGPVMGAANPHLKYFEGNRYGYDVYEVTPQRWSTHMRVIGDRRDPNSAVTTLTTFHVDRGKAGSYVDPATAGSPAQYRRP